MHETPVVSSKAHPLANLKAIVALVSLTATGLLGLYAENEVLTIIVVVSGTFGTWLATNAVVLTPEETGAVHGTPPEAQAEAEADPYWNDPLL